MVNSLRKLTSRLGVKIKVIYSWDVNEILDILKDYNRAAKKDKVDELRIDGNVIDVQELLSKADPKVYREVRLKKTTDFGKFQREIARSIDEGIPLLWSVNLGLVRKEHHSIRRRPHAPHHRLRSEKNEILYSDSWGYGHEEKRMSFEDAWTITSGLYRLEPVGT